MSSAGSFAWIPFITRRYPRAVYHLVYHDMAGVEVVDTKGRLIVYDLQQVTIALSTSV